MRRLVVTLGLAGVVLAACGTTTLASATGTWVRQSDFPGAVSSLHGDVRRATAALERPESTAQDLHTVCGVLEFELEEANASLPTPDDQSTTLLAAAYGELGVGASHCYHAAGDVPVRDEALAALSRGTAELAEGVIRVSVAEGKSP